MKICLFAGHSAAEFSPAQSHFYSNSKVYVIPAQDNEKLTCDFMVKRTVHIFDSKRIFLLIVFLSAIFLAVLPFTHALSEWDLSCTPACRVNSDCNDNNPATRDVCAGPGRCTAICISMPSCGDGICKAEEDETSCSCPQDCGSCYAPLQGTCREMNCIGKSCRETITLGCCGNGICDLSENYSNCIPDCKPKNVVFNFLDYNEGTYFVRGEKVDFKASVLADGVALSNASVSVEGFFGKIVLSNDGLHGDDKAGDNVYGGSFTIGNDTPEDDYQATFSVDAAGSPKTYFKALKVKPVLDLTLSAGKRVYLLSDTISIKGKVKRKGSAIRVPVRLVMSSPSEVLADENITPSFDGSFRFEYKTATIQEIGKWKVAATAVDQNNNSASLEKQFEVIKPGSIISLNVKIELSKSTVERGDELSVSVSIADDSDDNSVMDVSVKVFGKEYSAKKGKDGKYAALIPVDFSFSLGEQEAIVVAKKNVDGVPYSGSANAGFTVEKTGITLEVTEPQKRHYLIGDFLPIEVKLTYPDGRSVENAIVNASLPEETIQLKPLDKGIYYAEYLVPESSGGVIAIIFDANDSFGNNGSASRQTDVSGYSLAHYARNYGIAVAIALFTILLAAAQVYSMTAKKTRLNKLKEKEAETLKAIKELQFQYFKEASIDKKTYSAEVGEYEEKLKDIRQMIIGLDGESSKE